MSSGMSSRGRVALLAVLLGVLAYLLWAASQRQLVIVPEFFRDPTPHEAYRLGLSEAGLGETALGRDWIRTARRALRSPVVADLPYQEEGFFPPEEASAMGYRFPLRRGQRLAMRVEVAGSDSSRVFVDLFRAAPDTVRAPVHVLYGDAGEELTYEPRRTGDYILRVQPELLRGGRFRVVLRVEPALAFPVAGRSTRSIGSFFGAPRDGGRREHHGVDIFAPRGTPVVAAAEGRVARVDTTPIGGRVIWLRDSRGRASHYYAHLEEHRVRRGARVRPGDTLGTVGNTGNARTTPPHLHFGIYARGEGPIDPWDFLYQPPGEVQEVVVALEELGEWARIRGEGIRLRQGPSRGSQILSELPRHTALRVLGGVGSWYRVRLPDGQAGFVAGRLTEEIGSPLWMERVAAAQPIQAEPLPGAPVMEEFPEGADVPVLGTFGDFLLVRSPQGRSGWMMAEEEAASPQAH